jgi:serine/threonine-protein kinase PknG
MNSNSCKGCLGGFLMSSCPNCHQPVAPTDDICENCGAVLSTLIPSPAFVAASAPLVSASSSVVGTGQAQGNGATPTTPGACPNCAQPLHPGDDICEQCGMVVSGVVASSGNTNTTIPQAGQSKPLAVSQATVGGDVCPSCGTPRKPGVKFCGRCGANHMGITSPTSGGFVTSSAASAASTLQVGSILNNKYKVMKQVGSGGMGAVYLAEDLVLKRQVVIKALLSDDDPGMVEQSVKEREFLAAIKHANIVSIYDFITIGLRGYIVMEYVHGKTLDEILEEQGKPFDVPVAIRHILGVLPTFSYLAKLGLVYCDFKPQNVMLEVLKDGTEIVKLIDLGTVIHYEPRPKDVYGTHGFFAPEAVKSPSSETDLYTICRTLAYLVTQMDLASPIFGIPSSESYQAFREYPALYRLLAKGTHKNPTQRFHSAEELTDQLNGVLRQIVGGTPGVLVDSKLFVPGTLTTTGKLGLRAEVILDEKDKAIDQLRFGDQSLRTGDYASATNFYKLAAKSNPQSVDAHLRLAEVYIDQGEFSQALFEITQVQRKAPGHWKVAWYTGRLLEVQGKLSEAAEQYRELMADLPGELPPQQALARVSARTGDDIAAIELYNKILKADPSNTDAILGVTASLFNLQRWDEAARILGSVNEAAGKYVEAQLMLCDLYLKRMQPLSTMNIQRAAQVVTSLNGRTEDARYFLIRAEVYRAAWKMARNHQLSSNKLDGVSDTMPRTLGAEAEHNYKEYLRREHKPLNRETIVRHKLEVAPWRLL